MSHVAQINKPRRKYASVTSHIWMSHVARMDESRRTYEGFRSHIWMSHVAHMNESRRTYEWGTWKLQDSVVGCRVRSYACESCYSWMNATCHSHMNALTVLGCRVPSSFLDHHLIACIVWCYSASQCVAVCCSVYRLQSLDESSSFLDVSAARKASWNKAGVEPVN